MRATVLLLILCAPFAFRPENEECPVDLLDSNCLVIKVRIVQQIRLNQPINSSLARMVLWRTGMCVDKGKRGVREWGGVRCHGKTPRCQFIISMTWLYDTPLSVFHYSVQSTRIVCFERQKRTRLYLGKFHVTFSSFSSSSSSSSVCS